MPQKEILENILTAIRQRESPQPGGSFFQKQIFLIPTA
ncbi:Uncharacterised protein [Legionella birminghamensis]|uniref:Uncharacterized protein n=1 Tax=Legionella birminghamensis TaxID=28083 RepID=A0A378IC29_9GAMM|nr:Uncharacterised protein [Legionella birminghamensis]